MATLAGASSTISTINVPQLPGSPKSLKFTNVIPVVTFRPVRVKQSPICCTKLTPWEPSPAKHAPVEDGGYDFLQKTTTIFKTLGSENTAEAPLASAKTEEVTAPLEELQFLKWRTWLLGPSLLLSTGMIHVLGQKKSTQNCNSKPPFSYQFWNMVANVTRFIIPLLLLFGFQKGFVQPQLSLIPFAVLLGP